jgi:hypothetical protein
MDLLVSFGWIMLGFVLTMCASKIACKVGMAKKYGAEAEQQEEGKKVSTNVPY